MAEEKNTESFALGLIVAAIVYFLLRREWGRISVAGRETSKNAPANATSVSAGASCCGGGSSSSGDKQAVAVNPGISLGGESYAPRVESFPPSSVVAQPKIIWTS